MKLLGKQACKCGRRVIVARDGHGKLPLDPPECATCQTYGLEESKRLFVQEECMIKQKGRNTKFTITKGRVHTNSWKK